MDFLFMNEVLPKVLRVVLFNKNAAKPGSRITQSSLLGNAWGVTKVTAPSIALSAMLVQCLLSGDDTLTPVGSITKFEYWQNYKEFYKLIVLAGNSSWATTLFRFFNERVFQGGASSHVSGGVEDEIEQALVQLNLGPSGNNAGPSTATYNDTRSPGSGSETTTTNSNNPISPPTNTSVQPITTVVTPDSHQRIPRSVREAHPLFTDGTELLGGEPTGVRRALPTSPILPSLPGPPGPPPTSFPTAPQAEVVETEREDSEPEIVEQANMSGRRGGFSGSRGRGNIHQGVAPTGEVEATPATEAAPRPRPKARGRAKKGPVEAGATGERRSTRARATQP
ncbi:hypothetical protein V5O48_010486 [Marasmius crinis-equi]|uniref:Uncharacterized protein n=1 Tax=Marasmius crinis-equi TaxID=585013 RepID=A0ABR3F8V8_9AGAR